MSSDRVDAAALARTAVPAGITDPVDKARAELKAALAAIEVKGNIPRRMGEATDRGVARARTFAREQPAVTAAAVVAVAVAVGAVVWGVVRLYTR
ncbi:MAG: hypothetical protein QM611_02250 [Microbacterium sp.]|uniref:hypothetical protein n=1 Tax=Microbacterium sp. TaxID=51671 RepID=UPI0039E2D240